MRKFTLFDMQLIKLLSCRMILLLAVATIQCKCNTQIFFFTHSVKLLTFSVLSFSFISLHKTIYFFKLLINMHESSFKAIFNRLSKVIGRECCGFSLLWSKKLALPSQQIRYKPITDHDLVTLIFPRFGKFAWF